MTGVTGVAGCRSDGDIKSESIANEANNNMTAVQELPVTARPSSGSVRDPVSVATQTSRSVRKPVVLFFGTSLTAGLGLEPEQAFPSLVEKLADSAGLPIRAVNAGQSGETSAGAVRRIDWVLRSPADVVVLEVGANDALRGLAPAAAKSNLESLIAAVRRKQPRARIVLLQMEAPPNFGLDYTRTFRAIYADVAREENVMLVPFLLDGVAGIPRLNQADGIHPNLAGERIVAANVWRALMPVIAQLVRTDDNVTGSGNRSVTR
jgi:acyl-CoA thioesterase-1